MKLRYFILLLVPLFVSCVGEDIRNEEGRFTLAFNNTLFSIAIDEVRDEKLNVFPRISVSAGELPEDIEFEVTSSRADVLNINDEGGQIRFEPLSAGSTILTIDAFAGVVNSEGTEVRSLISSTEKELIVGQQTLTIIESTNLGNNAIRIANEGFTNVSITNPLSSIDLNSTETFTLEASLTDRNNQQPTGATFEWVSSDENILTVSPEGILTPVAEGSATVTVRLTNPNDFELNATFDITEELVVVVGDTTEVVIVEPEPPVVTSDIVGFGNFEGTGYRVSGSFEIIDNNGQLIIDVSSDFRTASLPDLVIYLSNSQFSNGGALIIDDTIRASGGQSFNIPPGTNLNDYTNVLLFCRAFGAPVGFGAIVR